MEPRAWHHLSPQDCLKQLNTQFEGLTQAEAEKRLATYGENKIQSSVRYSLLKKIVSQFNNVLIAILLVAAVITGMLGHWIDTSVILGVVILNACIGFIQENKAEKAIEALKKILSLKASVMREGNRLHLDASALVPGDIVFLKNGDKVPADLRLLKSNTLQIDEAILTGESVPVDKNIDEVNIKTAITDQHSMAFSGTYVTYGVGVGVVVATGKETEIGKISAMLKSVPTFTTPLLKQLTRFGRWIAFWILAFALMTFAFGIWVRDYSVQEMFMAAVAIAVSIIPEGLPAIITITLAIGVTRMAKHNAIIRRLASVETLSSVTVICTDKTGTLTKNELTVQKVVTYQKAYEVSGSGYNDEGVIHDEGKPVVLEAHPSLQTLIRAGVLCNEADLHEVDSSWRLEGNPMDGALLALGLKAELQEEIENKNYPRLDMIPFDSEHKFMATLHHDHKNGSYIFIKGAPEIILAKCGQQLDTQGPSLLDKNFWTEQINALAQNGMRVLAIAMHQPENKPPHLSFKHVEKSLTLLGIVGVIDPPREEALEAVASCQKAGITVKMVTGDHKLTACAIAKQVGLPAKKVLSGENLNTLNDEQLAEMVEHVDIFARTVPEQKIRLIKALHANEHIVAMTGDGINDAPAIKSADIGISMGIKGTDVAKEASEIVLTDDNFASIRQAVKEGRNVYNNLKKTILFILPNDGGEGFSIFFAILLGYTLPITPAQILWVNMVTAVTLALALAFEPAEEKLMRQKPRNPNESLISKFLIWRFGFVSMLYVCAMFGLFIYETKQNSSIELARTMVVDVLVFLEAVYLINCRRIYDSVFSFEGIFGSKPILIAIGLVVLLQIGFTHLPFMQYLFKTQALSLNQWGVIVLISIAMFIIVEIEKWIIRRFRTENTV